jgi:hypothetical protein
MELDVNALQLLPETDQVGGMFPCRPIPTDCNLPTCGNINSCKQQTF